MWLSWGNQILTCLPAIGGLFAGEAIGGSSLRTAKCFQIFTGWMPIRAAISLVGILSAAQYIIDMSFDSMLPVVERFVSKNLALKNRTTLREGCFNTTDNNKLFAFSAKLEQK
jgi:hypothetical protein